MKRTLMIAAIAALLSSPAWAGVQQGGYDKNNMDTTKKHMTTHHKGGAKKHTGKKTMKKTKVEEKEKTKTETGTEKK